MTEGDLPPRRTLKLTIAYDGTDYAGWQFQPGKPTVQEAIENAIAKVTGQRTRVLASGRTDAGVHALGQVIGFRTDSALPPEVLLRAINANLPRDIAVLEAAETHDDFCATRDAVRKRYRYTIHHGPVRDVLSRHFVWHYPYGRLNAEAMQRAAAALLGKHDFSSFESSGAERKTSVRTIFELCIERGRAGEAEGGREGSGIGDWGLVEGKVASPKSLNPQIPKSQFSLSSDFITIDVEADGFLYNMVRAIVGTLVEVGRGARPESWPGEVLLAADRTVAGPTAPPQGLCLIRVEYENT